MIDVRDLTKQYGEAVALAGVSFSVRPGEIIGLLGPNGAGKTTLMKILTGYLHPSAGTAEVGGYDVLEHTGKVQELIGYLPENAPLYPELSVQGHLLMMAELRGIPKAEQSRCLTDAVRAVGLKDRLTRPVGTLSKGYRQRVGLAQAILHKPKLLILDEPTNGLDPNQIVEVRHLIRKLAKHSTVLVSTHILSEVEATCDRALILINGHLMADARLAELSATSNALVTVAGDGEVVKKTLSQLAGVRQVDIVDTKNGEVSLRAHGDSHENLCPAIFRMARDNDWSLVELKRDVRNLEGVFNELTSRGGAR